ncbi:MAG TPA: hypothetical protein VFC24_07505 [Casimicrobiaceae bacterium]|nr:hypothetical protein [Casimicrobiaceae bacterium]
MLLVLAASAALQGCMVATATMAVGSAAVAVGGAAVSTASAVGGAVVSGTSAVVRAVTPKGRGDDARAVPEDGATDAVVDDTTALVDDDTRVQTLP